MCHVTLSETDPLKNSPHLTPSLPNSTLIFVPPLQFLPLNHLSSINPPFLLASFPPPLLGLVYLPYITSLVSSCSLSPPPPLPLTPPTPTVSSSFPTECLLFHSFAHSLTRSPIHSFTCASFIPLFNRHSFTGLPTRRGFIGGQLRHLRFQSSPAECLPPHFLTRLFTLLLLFTRSLVLVSGLSHALMYRVAGSATRIYADKSENTFLVFQEPRNLLHRFSSKRIHLKVLVSCTVESSADLWLSRDAFLKSLGFLVHTFAKYFFKAR